MRVTILTLGSRGDVQPYVGLGAALAARGHLVTVAAGAAFEPLIRRAGLAACVVEPDPRLVADGANPPRWFRPEVAFAARRLLTGGGGAGPWSRLYAGYQAASRGADVLLYPAWAAPVARILGEALGVLTISAYLTPVHPTQAFPSPFVKFPANATLNPIGHQLALWMMGMAFGDLPNAWRRELPLPPAAIRPISSDMTACLYGYSQVLVPRPDDWPDHVKVSGPWWWHDPGWRPPPDLARFIHAPGEVIYLGFGSMLDSRPQALKQIVKQALADLGCRAVYSPGPANQLALGTSQFLMPIAEVPFDWLFPRVDAIVHHGGAGTTAEAARSGKPSLGVPFFGDQFFWSGRVHDQGAGPAPIPRRRLTAQRLASAIDLALHDPGIREQAELLGARVRAERGLTEAVETIENLWATNPGSAG